ncbi:MAG: IS30 family transposase [Halieaceae bacterium]|jgi:IS30 family transposase
MVCATTIYGFIQRDKGSGGYLYQHLRHRKPYQRRTGSPDARSQNIGRISIDERPSIVNEKEHLQTITFDNDREFACHAQIKKALGADNYFAHPYHSWERGLNENHNGLIRQYLPKGMALDKVADEDIILIQNRLSNRLNNRPRKLLDCKTPNAVYDTMRLAA